MCNIKYAEQVDAPMQMYTYAYFGSMYVYLTDTFLISGRAASGRGCQNRCCNKVGSPNVTDDRQSKAVRNYGHHVDVVVRRRELQHAARGRRHRQLLVHHRGGPKDGTGDIA